MSVSHRVLKDLTFRGYNIPRDNCIVLANLYAVNYDPKTFPNPELFNPDRFINDDGKLIKNDTVIPFGMGKCIIPNNTMLIPINVRLVGGCY